jgi:hypothetical protein
MTRTCGFVFAAFVLTRAAAAGQPPPSPGGLSPACQAVVELVREAPTPDARQARATELANMNLHPRCFSEIILRGTMQRDAYARFLKAFESRRTDKQTGSTTGTGGSTSLVAKGTTAKVLSLAAEYGALTQSVNEQVVTVRGSLDGVPAALVRQRVLPYCPTQAPSPDCVHRDLFEALRRVSYGVSFDTSAGAQQAIGTPTGAASGTAQPVTFEANGHSITAANLSVVLWSTRDAISPAFQAAWLKAVKSESSAPLMGAAAVSLLTALEQLITPILGDADYRRWQQETVARLGRANTTDVDAIWIDRERTLAAIVEQVNPALVDRAAEFSRALSMYQFEQEDLVRAVAEKPVLTLQYDYKRPNELLPTSTARLIFDKGFGDHWSLAANGAVEIYDRRPPSDIPGAGRIRDAQLGIEVQRDLGAFALVGAAALSGTYYFQYQNGPSILKVSPATPLAGIAFTRLPSSAAFVFVDTTHLHVAQIRLVLGPPSSSARFPIAVSYSNRTELIARSVVRAQFGVSYDFDSLFAR